MRAVFFQPTSRTLRPTSTDLSGNVAALSILPTYNQASGTASNTDLLINRTETAVGSGNQYLLQLQVGGQDRFRVTNQGVVTTYNSMRIGDTNPSGARLTLSGGFGGPAWGDNGITFRAEAAVYTDTSTAASGTVSLAAFNTFARPTLAASNTGVTTQTAATVYIDGSPIAGTNQSISTAYALMVNGGPSLFNGPVYGPRGIASRTAAMSPSTGNQINTNEGASARVDLTLPSGVYGTEIAFIVQNANGLRLVAPAGMTIRVGSLVSTSGGYIQSTTVGDTVSLVQVNGTQWMAIASTGSGWTAA